MHGRLVSKHKHANPKHSAAGKQLKHVYQSAILLFSLKKKKKKKPDGLSYVI